MTITVNFGGLNHFAIFGRGDRGLRESTQLLFFLDSSVQSLTDLFSQFLFIYDTNYL